MSGFFGLLFQEGEDSSDLPYLQQGFGEGLKSGFLSCLWIPHLSGLRIDFDLIPFIENRARPFGQYGVQSQADAISEIDPCHRFGDDKMNPQLLDDGRGLLPARSTAEVVSTDDDVAFPDCFMKLGENGTEGVLRQFLHGKMELRPGG